MHRPISVHKTKKRGLFKGVANVQKWGEKSWEKVIKGDQKRAGYQWNDILDCHEVKIRVSSRINFYFPHRWSLR